MQLLKYLQNWWAKSFKVKGSKYFDEVVENCSKLVVQNLSIYFFVLPFPISVERYQFFNRSQGKGSKINFQFKIFFKSHLLFNFQGDQSSKKLIVFFVLTLYLRHKSYLFFMRLFSCTKVGVEAKIMEHFLIFSLRIIFFCHKFLKRFFHIKPFHCNFLQFKFIFALMNFSNIMIEFSNILIIILLLNSCWKYCFRKIRLYWIEVHFYED